VACMCDTQRVMAVGQVRGNLGETLGPAPLRITEKIEPRESRIEVESCTKPERTIVSKLLIQPDHKDVFVEIKQITGTGREEIGACAVTHSCKERVTTQVSTSVQREPMQLPDQVEPEIVEDRYVPPNGTNDEQ